MLASARILFISLGSIFWWNSLTATCVKMFNGYLTYVNGNQLNFNYVNFRLKFIKKCKWYNLAYIVGVSEIVYVQGPNLMVSIWTQNQGNQFGRIFAYWILKWPRCSKITRYIFSHTAFF
jgi:hypothetical protein